VELAEVMHLQEEEVFQVMLEQDQMELEEHQLQFQNMAHI